MNTKQVAMNGLPPTITVDADFPGGNIIVERIDGDTLHLKQDMRDSENWWFHWAFRLRGAAGRTIEVQFGAENNPVGMRGPAMSLDGGWTWAWQSDDFGPGRFSVVIPSDADEVLLAFADLYTQRHWERFLERIGPSPFLEAGVLTTTRKGRDIERFRIGCIDRDPQQRVIITARHHACESMANYVMEGLIEGMLAEGPDGAWLRNNVEFLVIPFVDKDGVEDGDQGKNRRPHDHNRDYIGESVHKEVAAIREWVPRWSDGKLVASLDLHCPYIRGEWNDIVFQVGRKPPQIWAEQQRLGAILERLQSGTLNYRNSDNLPFGMHWNVGAAAGSLNFSGWSMLQPGIRLATSFEIAYATANGNVVSAATCRTFGQDLAQALAAYLRKP